jgi:predicted AAA+ superfamily ATPase
VGFVDLSGFDLGETGPSDFRRLWQRGGLPRSYLARDASASFDWRQDFIRTFLERDVPQLGVRIPAEQLRRFWTMVAHYHGQVLNAAELSRSLAVAEGTVRNYLDLLSGAYVVRQLQPWFENLKKRQVKSPKVYVRDSGLLHALLLLASERDLQSHPKVGASWEGFVIEQLLTQLDARNAYFWATHAGAELDLFVSTEGRRVGFEVKHADAPRTTKSMHVAIADLQLDHLFVVYPGDVRYQLLPKATAMPIADVPRVLEIISDV